MSGPNTMFALPPDERPGAYAPEPAPDLAPQGELQLSPGATLTLDRLDTLFDDLLLLRADLRAARNEGSFAAFEARLHKLADVAAVAAKTVTRERKRPPSRSQAKE